MSERVIILGGDVERTPEQEYKNATRVWREAATKRDETRRQLDALDTEAIYSIFEYDGLSVRKVEVLKATPKQYRVRYIGHNYTLPRAPIDSGETATSGHERFASGRAVRPMLQEQLDNYTRGTERLASRMEEKRQALQRNAE